MFRDKQLWEPNFGVQADTETHRPKNKYRGDVQLQQQTVLPIKD